MNDPTNWNAEPLDPSEVARLGQNIRDKFGLHSREAAMYALLALNTRPSITEGVPEGWRLDRLLAQPYGSKPIGAAWWCALEATGMVCTVEGVGPTPEAAIKDAANKARSGG